MAAAAAAGQGEGGGAAAAVAAAAAAVAAPPSAFEFQLHSLNFIHTLQTSGGCVGEGAQEGVAAAQAAQ